MATTTATGPINIPQINGTYYVGEAFLGTIQQAVTYAVANGSGTVVVPAEYAGSDLITAVTGGSASVYIMDERSGQRQIYLWFNGVYVAEPILPVGIGTSQINHWLFVGAISKYTTIQSAVTYAATLASGHFAIIIQPNYNAGENIASITGGNSTMYLSDQRNDEWQNYRWNGTQFVPSDVLVGGDLNVAGDIYGANLQLVGNLQATDGTFTGSITAGDDLTVAGGATVLGDLSADTATFTDCMVDDSPVRTFANTPDGPGEGMVWPQTGEFAISGGDHWQNFLSAEPQDFNGGSGMYMGYSSGVTNFYNQGTPMGAYNFWAVDSGGNRARVFALNTQFNTPAYTLFNPNAAANSQQWTTYMGGDGSWMFAPAADNGVSEGACMSFTRNGTTVTGWSVSATSANVNGTTVAVNGAQGITLNGPITATSGITAQEIQLSGGGAGIGVSRAMLDYFQGGARLTGRGPAAPAATLGTIQLDGLSGDGSTSAIYLNCNGPYSTFNNILGTSSNAGAWGPITTLANGLQITWNLQTGSGETDFINAHAGGAGGFNWYNWPSTTVIPAGTTPGMNLDGSNNLIVQGAIVGNDGGGAKSFIQAGSTAIGGTAGQAETRFVAVVSGQSGVSYAGQFNIDTSSSTSASSSATDRLAIWHRSVGPDGGSATLWSINRAGVMGVGAESLHIGQRGGNTWSSTTPNINSDNQNLYINSASNGSLVLNIDEGQNIIFGNGAGGTVGNLNNAGQLTLNGTITTGAAVVTGLGFHTQQLGISADGASSFIDGGSFLWVNQNAQVAGFTMHVIGTFTASSKNFRIPHPLDDTKFLNHSCIEGPEVAVFYRGEGETVNGVATITLPDYFEALTRKEGRTIQLTERFDDDNPVFGNFLAAGRVKDGKFNVRSNNGSAKFYWEVKAVRRDIDPLQIITNKADYPEPKRPEPEPEAKPAPKAKKSKGD